MALKYKLATLEGVAENIKALYTKVGEEYVLAVDDLPKPDTTSNSDLADRLLKVEANNAALLEEKRIAKTALEKLNDEQLKKGGDTDALEKSYLAKIDTLTVTKDAELTVYRKMVEDLTITAQSSIIGADVFGVNAEIMNHHIRNRLSLDIVEGVPKVRVLGLDGKPSAATVDELTTELKINPKFASLVIATKANGGPNFNADGTPVTVGKKFSDFTGSELSVIQKNDPKEYDRLKSTK